MTLPPPFPNDLPSHLPPTCPPISAVAAFNLAFVNLASFPASLKRLDLTFCMFPDDFFDVLKTG